MVHPGGVKSPLQSFFLSQMNLRQEVEEAVKGGEEGVLQLECSLVEGQVNVLPLCCDTVSYSLRQRWQAVSEIDQAMSEIDQAVSEIDQAVSEIDQAIYTCKNCVSTMLMLAPYSGSELKTSWPYLTLTSPGEPVSTVLL